MKMMDCHPLDEIFSHEDTEGVTRHFNATQMVRAIVNHQINPIMAVLDLYEDLVRHLIANHGIEEDHLHQIGSTLDSPILLVEFADGTNLIVDGNHRVVKRWQEGLKTVTAAILKPGVWEPYLVEDMQLPREMYAIKKELV